MVPSEASVCASSSYLGWCSQGRPSSSAKRATTRDPTPYLSRSNRFRCPPVTDGQTNTQTDNYNFSIMMMGVIVIATKTGRSLQIGLYHNTLLIHAMIHTRGINTRDQSHLSSADHCMNTHTQYVC